MEDRLISKDFDVRTKYYTYPARFIAPLWAQGFECKNGECGLCCLTEIPDDVPTIGNASFNRAICAFFDLKRKLCKKYATRPSTCKLYPFIFGVENGRILVSTSLECPGTNTKTTIEPQVLIDVLEDPYAGQIITLMNDLYERAILNHQIWLDGDRIWQILTNRVKDYFRQKTSFPFLSEVRNFIVETISNALNIPTPNINEYSVPRLVKHACGLYIATRMESFQLCLAKTIGSKTLQIVFNEELMVKKRLRMKTPTMFLNLEIDKGAHELLNDYVSFICNRPFLSVASIMATTIKPSPVPVFLMNTFGGSFMPLEVGATLIASREKLQKIDRDIMREIISFSEGSLASTFRRPDIAVRGIR